MIIIINGMPGTGKTTLAKKLAGEYGYTYINDWKIFKENNIVINEFEDKNIISKKYSKLISDYVKKNKDSKAVFDLEYSISPNDFIKHKLNYIAQCFYLGFATLPNKLIFNLFRKSSNNHISDDELKRKIEFYKNNSVEYQKQCQKNALEFIDICKDRSVIFDEILARFHQ